MHFNFESLCSPLKGVEPRRCYPGGVHDHILILTFFLWMNNTFDMFINFYENPIITLKWASSIYHFIKLKRNFETLMNLFLESVNSFSTVILSMIHYHLELHYLYVLHFIISYWFLQAFMCTTQIMWLRKVWIVNKQRKTSGIYM